MIKVNCLCTSDIKKIILDEFERLEMKNYRRICEPEAGFVLTFQWGNPILQDVVKDKESLAACLAACWMTMHMSEDEVRKAAAEIFEYYDDSDIVPDWRDEDGY